MEEIPNSVGTGTKTTMMIFDRLPVQYLLYSTYCSLVRHRRKSRILVGKAHSQVTRRRYLDLHYDAHSSLEVLPYLVQYCNDTPQQGSNDIPGNMILGIAGGSGSGKTTLTKKLYEQLGEENLVILYHDSYYKDITHLTLEERAKTNFDHPDSLDTELLIQHVQELRKGQTIEVPTYDFATHSRTSTTTRVSPRNIIIVEGILIFSNVELVRHLDLKIYVDSDPDIRFIRRLQRDVAERGRTVDDVCTQYQEQVRPMHERFVEPSKYSADIIVHSTRGDDTSMGATIRMVLNHLRVEAGLV